MSLSKARRDIKLYEVTCSKCGTVHSRVKKGSTICKECRSIANKKWMEENKERRKKYMEKYRSRRNRLQQIWREKNKEKVFQYQQKIRLEILNHYSKTPLPSCACCSERNIEFLTLDHIYNNGAEERKNGLEGRNLFYYLRKNNFPDGYQVLCMNCNWAKAKYGYCPHNISK